MKIWNMIKVTEPDLHIDDHLIVFSQILCSMYVFLSNSLFDTRCLIQNIVSLHCCMIFSVPKYFIMMT